MKKRLLIILARGNSKRIKNKNIKFFFGKPMINFPINVAKKCNLFSKIHVSTESLKVKKIVKNLGHDIDFMRPKKLSTNNTPIIKVLRYITEKYEESGQKFDEIWNLSACTPLLMKSDLIKASKKVKKNKVLISITKYSAPIEWAFTKSINEKLKAYSPQKLTLNSQKIPQQYHDAGAFVVFSKSNLLNKKFNYLKNFIGYELPRHRAVDIDHIDDWKLAEQLYKLKVK